MRSVAQAWRAAGDSIGLVPTMGALHAGHLSLVRAGRAENARLVVSIFVNPLQFGLGDDFQRYPRAFERDLELLAPEGVDAVYQPSAEAMYPPGARTRVRVEQLQDVIEGASRPGHFEGVATVVTKLLNTVRPDRAYFGAKDAQQAFLVMRLAADLDSGVEIRVLPTVRDVDGLALSSRNAYLSPEQRRAALSLYRALATAQQAYERGVRDPDRLRALLLEVIEAEPGCELDYAVVVDADTFKPAARDAARLRALVAGRVGGTRLIDNHLLGEPLPN